MSPSKVLCVHGAQAAPVRHHPVRPVLQARECLASECVLQADAHAVVVCIDALPGVSKVMVAQLMTDRAELTPGLPGPRIPLLKAPCQRGPGRA